MGDDAGARAGQDSQRGVREPRIRFHFSLQSVYDMSFKTCNATEALRVRLSHHDRSTFRPGGAARTRDALVPPNPKLFVSTARIPSFRFAFSGVKSAEPKSPKLGSNRSRFSVGGTTRLASARIANAASTAPAAPSKCPVAPFVDDTESAPDVR